MEDEQPKKRMKVGVPMEMKKAMIAQYEAGSRVSEIAKQYGRSTSTISTIIGQKERLKTVEVVKGVTLITKQRLQGIDEVEKKLLEWLNDSEKSSCGIPNETAIRCKARQLHKELVKEAGDWSIKSFKASRGWYENFRKRTDFFKNQTRKIGFCRGDNSDEEGQLKPSTGELSDPSDKNNDVPISASYKSDDSDVDLHPVRNSWEENCPPSSVNDTKEDESVSGVPSSVIEKVCSEWEAIRIFVELTYPDRTVAGRAIQTFDEVVMSYFRDVVRSREEQRCDINGEFIKRELPPVVEDGPKKSRRKSKPRKKLVDIFLKDCDLM